MKLYRIVIFAAMCLSMIGCGSLDPTDYNELLDKSIQLKAFDLNMYQMKADFCGAKYSGIKDTDIQSVNVLDSVKNGNIILVTYNYGIATLERCYYEDIKGNTVKLKKSGAIKANGYPSVDSFTRDINEYGFVVYDWAMICIVISFIIGLLLWFFVG